MATYKTFDVSIIPAAGQAAAPVATATSESQSASGMKSRWPGATGVQADNIFSPGQSRVVVTVGAKVVGYVLTDPPTQAINPSAWV